MRATVCVIVTGLVTGAWGIAGPKPDFSGTWTLDRERSFSNPPGLEQTMTIAHTGEEVRIQAKLKTAQGERAIEESWTTDGQEREFSPPGAPEGSKGKRKAYWLPGDRALVVADETSLAGPNGPTTQQTTRKLTLSADRTTLTIDYYLDTPKGSFESRRVFRR
jgi:hypothetical protein